MKRKMFVIMAKSGIIEDKENDTETEYGNVLCVDQKAPELFKGKKGHEVQKLSGLPSVIQALGETGLIPCIVEFELQMRGSRPYIVNAVPDAKTSGQFKEFLSALEKAAGTAPDSGLERVLVFMTSRFKQFGKIQALNLQEPEEMDGQYGYPVSLELKADASTADAIARDGIPALVDIETDIRQVQKKSGFMVVSGKYHERTRGMWNDFLNKIFGSEKVGNKTPKEEFKPKPITTMPGVPATGN